MTLAQYEKLKHERRLSAWSPRALCDRCRKPGPTCYCAFIRPFVSDPEFVILIHHQEIRRNVATGRMSHLCLENSHFFEGVDFTHHEKVNALLANPSYYPVLLYPKFNPLNLSPLTSKERAELFPKNKKLLIFVLDATWGQAKRMRRLSRNLHSLPRICFTPPEKSRFLVRKQPDEQCYSTIESIHHMIDLLGEERDQGQGNLLEVFQAMVDQQLLFGHRRLIRNSK